MPYLKSVMQNNCGVIYASKKKELGYEGNDNFYDMLGECCIDGRMKRMTCYKREKDGKKYISIKFSDFDTSYLKKQGSAVSWEFVDQKFRRSLGTEKERIRYKRPTRDLLTELLENLP